MPVPLEPKKHHYLPQFYLKRWCGNNGKLTQFQRPYGPTVRPRRVYPAETGFVLNLYSVETLDGNFDAGNETQFFSPVDSQAAQALNLLETELDGAEWRSGPRSAWSRFITSLLLRMPEDIEKTRQYWQKAMANPSQYDVAHYQQERLRGDPDSLVQALKDVPAEAHERAVFGMLRRVMNGSRLGNTLNNMHWSTVDISGRPHELFTSDRPVLSANGLGAEDSEILFPIGPNLLFVATRTAAHLQEIKAIPVATLITHVNQHVVGQAVRFVYASTDRDIRFVQNRMSNRPDRRIIDRLLERQADAIN